MSHGRLNRLFGIALGAAIAAAGSAWAPAALAAEPSIRVIGGTQIEAFTARVDRLGDRILQDVTAARDGVGKGDLHYFDLNKPLKDLAGFDDLPAADRVLMRGAKRTYDLFRALGGPRVDAFAVTATEKERYYLSLDGEGGRWLTTPGAALTVLARQLVGEKTVQLTGAGSSASPCPQDYRCLLKSLYDRSAVIATVPRGSTVTLEMTGSGFSDKGGAPVVIAPDGITPHDVAVLNHEKITARISVDSNAPTGRHSVQVFNPGRQFGSQGIYPLMVVADPATLETPVAGDSAGEIGSRKTMPVHDDYPDTPDKAVPLGATVAARLEFAGDTDLFRIDVAKGGSLSIASEGPTDLVGELRTAKDKVIAVDDDSGPRYNFRLDTPPLAPGTYYLRVRHCCAGKGSYSLKRTFREN